MDSPQGSPTYETGVNTAPASDRLIGDTTVFNSRPVAAAPGTMVGENVMTVRDRIQWGPILGGVVSALVVFLLLTVLGIALGASVLEPRAPDTAGQIGTWAAIWGSLSIIAAFFIGGWIAARTAAVGGSFAGLMNGLIAGAAGLLFIVWLSATGLGNLFGMVGSTVTSIANVAASAAPAAQVTGQQAGNAIQDATGVNVDNPQQAADQAQQAAQQAADQAGQALAQANNPQTFEAIRNGAAGAFLGLLLPLIAAGLGGLVGKHTRDELIHGTGQ